jgi:hypothetical protein
MRPINVVLAYHDARSAERLAAVLRSQFRNLAVTKSPDEVSSAVARLRAPFAVVDLELIGLTELKQLCAQFPSTAFVCIHRLADDRMWTEALAMGAVDCCHSSDVRGILLASERYVVLSHAHHAAA